MIIKQTKIANLMISTAFVSGQYETIIFDTYEDLIFSTDVEKIDKTEDDALKTHSDFEKQIIAAAMGQFMGAKVEFLD